MGVPDGLTRGHPRHEEDRDGGEACAQDRDGGEQDEVVRHAVRGRALVHRGEAPRVAHDRDRG